MERLAVFIDYQNVHLGARELFAPYGQPVHESLVHPLAVAERIATKRSSRFPCEVTTVQVFRGRPNPEHQPTPTAANDAQTAAWERDDRVLVTRKDLNYRGWPEQKPREKGVDVALAIGLVQTALRGDYDAAVVFTNDTDLLPAVELAYYETKPPHRDRGVEGREAALVSFRTARAAVSAVLPFPERPRLRSRSRPYALSVRACRSAR
jgi:uncharacterized LabA/DUF88 family protein